MRYSIMERNPWLKAVLVLLAIIGTLWLMGWIWDLISRFGDILLLFFLAWLLAFVLHPVADWLTKVKVPWFRGPRPLSYRAAVLVVYLGLILLLVILGLLLIPVIVAQAIQLGASLPTYVAQLPRIGQLQEELDKLGVPVDLTTVYRPELIIDQARSLGGTLAQNALGIATGVANMTFNLLIILILSFYLMLDGPEISRKLLGLVPTQWQDEATFFMSSVTRTFGAFIRGQLLQALIYGLGTALIMAVAGLSYVAIVSAFSGLVMIIPFVGPFLAILPPAILAAIQAPGAFLWIFIALLVLQQVVINVIAPKFMSESLGMHPLLVFLAMLVGVKVAGFWGALFGVPVMGVLYAMAEFFYRRALEEEARGIRYYGLARHQDKSEEARK